MPTINELTATVALSAADQVPIYSADGGDTMRASLGLVAAFVNESATAVQSGFVVQYAAPLTGTAVTVAAGDTWLIASPAGTLAALTVALPTSRTAGQEVLVVSSQIITALTVSGAGTTVIGAPTAMAANGFFRMKYDGVMNAWYRVG